jgi:parallel beta-helix repeat protein
VISLKIYFKYINLLILILLFFVNVVFAEVIGPDTIISTSKTYENTTLDMTNGNLIVQNNATLTIKNCLVHGSVSPTTLNLINVVDGKLHIEKSNFSISATSLPADPNTTAISYVFLINKGQLSLVGNAFKIDKFYTAGLVVTNETNLTSDINIADNTIENFHGGTYLINSNNAHVTNNTFSMNSMGNIVLRGNNGVISKNIIKFSGNNNIGNGIDIFNSDNVNIFENTILDSSCYGILLLDSANITLSQNIIAGGITWAINIISFDQLKTKEKNIDDKFIKNSTYLLHYVANYKNKVSINKNIQIRNNFLLLNRYGLSASFVNTIDVESNIFIQKFNDSKSRKFWTDNNILLENVTNLTWQNNIYKEAFTQINGESNNLALQYVTFPQSGGVVF